MSKAMSGLFKDTQGTNMKQLKDLLSIPPEGTAEVWDHINATQESYPNSSIPRSFTIDVPKTPITPDGKLWTHGNASEHMYEPLLSIKNNPLIKNSNPNLYSQLILYDCYKALGKAMKSGVQYNVNKKVGNWEFIIAPPRAGAKYPVVIHAQFSGLGR